MKTLLYNPIFINPWAYIVFPNLGGNLKQEMDSVVEPAIFDGKIEVKTIANGDINLVRYYSNTNKIDLSEFKDSWIRINLYTDYLKLKMSHSIRLRIFWKDYIYKSSPNSLPYQVCYSHFIRSNYEIHCIPYRESKY